MEKELFVKELGELLHKGWPQVHKAYLEGNYVHLVFFSCTGGDDYEQLINVAGDSNLAVFKDVARALKY